MAEPETPNHPAPEVSEVPVEKQGPPEYELSALEQGLLQNLRSNVLQAKAQVYDLNVQLESARTQLMQAEAHFSGAYTQTALRAGLPGAKLTPDFKKFVYQG